jgi:hypothetical protein
MPQLVICLYTDAKGECPVIMREMALPNILPLEKQHDELNVFCKRRGRWLIGFFIGSIVGAGCGASGLVLSALWTLGFLRGAPVMNELATWMVVAAFPLLIFAAHSLDKAAAAERAIKAISYRERS